MSDFLNTSERSALMRRIKSSGGEAELALLAAVRRRGRRPRANVKELPGRPDQVFNRERLAVFVDGDYWHGGQWRRRGLKTLQQQFDTAEPEKARKWVRKIQGNVARDIRVTQRLHEMGWGVLRLWESDVLANPVAAAQRVYEALERSGHEPDRRNPAYGLAADFFAGVGLMRLGLERAGWRSVWANDHDATKRRLYLHNAGDGRVEIDTRDVREIEGDSLPQVGLAAACFPCTDLSLAGRKLGFEGKHSSAYWGFVDVLRDLGPRRPTFVILENVHGLIHSRGGEDFRLCLSGLSESGYNVDAVAIDAKHFVPQSRPRLFVIGVHSDVAFGPFEDLAELQPSPTRPAKLLDFMRQHDNLAWRVRPVPELPACNRRLTGILERVPSRDSRWWSEERVEKFKAQVSERHLATVEEVRAKGRIVTATAFRRMRHGRSTAELRFDGIAGCLRTPKGGSAKQMLVRVDQYGWHVRQLTAVECQRLMGADEFRADAEGVKNDDLLFAFGDAVCVPVVEWLATNYVNPIASELLHHSIE